MISLVRYCILYFGLENVLLIGFCCIFFSSFLKGLRIGNGREEGCTLKKIDYEIKSKQTAVK